jgi:hypothetical protein
MMILEIQLRMNLFSFGQMLPNPHHFNPKSAASQIGKIRRWSNRPAFSWQPIN